jgi:hypothetical protein
MLQREVAWRMANPALCCALDHLVGSRVKLIRDFKSIEGKSLLKSRGWLILDRWHGNFILYSVMEALHLTVKPGWVMFHGKKEAQAKAAILSATSIDKASGSDQGSRVREDCEPQRTATFSPDLDGVALSEDLRGLR